MKKMMLYLLGLTAFVMFPMAAFPAQRAEAWLTYDEWTWARAADSLVTNRFYGRATFSDTIRMRSDTTVALIFLLDRADSAWAFKARKGTTTWNTLMWGDTVGKVYAGNQFKTADLVFGPSAITSGYQGSSITFGASYITLDHIGKALYITATSDSGEAGMVAKRDSLYLKKIAKHAFGNAAANLTDTNLVAGATATSVIVGGDYLPDGASITYNALRKRVAPDTVYIYRVAVTDPDSINAITLIK